MSESDGTKAAADDQQTRHEQHTVARAPERPVGIPRRFSPGVRGQQATGGRGGKDVVIELETRDAEKAEHDDRPQPQQALTGLDRLVTPQPSEDIDAAAGHDRAPGKERTGERADVEGVIDGARGEFDRLREVPQIAREEISLHELVTKAPLHPQKPRRGGDHHRWKTDLPVQLRKHPSGLSRARPGGGDKHGDENEGDRSLGHDRERQQPVATPLDAKIRSLRRDEKAPERAEQKQREHHVEDSDRGQGKRRRNRREHDGAEGTNFRAEEFGANPSRHREEADRGQRRREPRGELRLAEKKDGRALQPVKEDGLVDERFAVEERHEPVPRVQHLARQFCVVRLIGIEQACIAEPPEDHDPSDRNPQELRRPASRHTSPRHARRKVRMSGNRQS